MKNIHSEDGVVTFAEAAKPMTATEVRAQIAKLEKDNAQMKAAQRTRQQQAISTLGEKLPQVEKVSQSEVNANLKLDAAIQKALFAWRKQAKDMHSLLRTPENVAFTIDELDLAGWTHEYASQENLTFQVALSQIFDFLKRYPKSLEKYTGSDASFAETAVGSVSLAAPRGWSVDPQRMASFRRIRVYQAGHPGCEFSEAITLAGVQ